METPKEKLANMLEKVSQEIDETNVMILNNPHDGALKNKLLGLLKYHKENYERYELLEISERQKKDKPILQQNTFPGQSKVENISPTNPPLKKVASERLLSKMTLNKLLYTLETQLSGNYDHLDLSDLEKTPTGNSHAYWYFKLQETAYNGLYCKIIDIEFDDYAHHLRHISDLITERNAMIRALLPSNDVNPLTNRLTTLESFQQKMEITLISHRSESTFYSLQEQLSKLVKAVEKELADLVMRAAQYNEN